MLKAGPQFREHYLLVNGSDREPRTFCGMEMDLKEEETMVYRVITKWCILLGPLL